MKEIIPRILIVDDTKINRFLLGQMVEQMGFIAETAPSATKGIEHIHNEMPQLILLDIMMPEIDGFQMCEMLKENPVTRDIPIIFVSAMGQPEEKEERFQLAHLTTSVSRLNMKRLRCVSIFTLRYIACTVS